MTFYELIRSVAKQLMEARAGIATGGSTTTLIDTNLDAPNDYYNGGLLFVDHTVPVINKITDWASATFTFTFPTSTAVAAGIKYTVVNERFPLDVIKNAINQCLIEDVGMIMMVDETITAVDDQEMYTLPANVSDVRRVEIGTEDETWKTNYCWQEELGKLRFLNDKPATGDTIRVHYATSHAELIDLDDTLDDRLNIDMIIHAACIHALQWRITKVRENEPGLKDKLAFHEMKAAFAKSRMGSWLLNRDPIHSRL